MTPEPRFAVGLSRQDDPVAAATEACSAVLAGLGTAAPTLVAMFASPSLCEEPERLLAAVHHLLDPEHLIGCTGEAILGAGREIEDGSALAVWAAHLPGARITPFRLVARPLEHGVGVLGWPDSLTGPEVAEAGPILMLADPFTFPADGLLDQLNSEDHRPVVVGGLASGARGPGEHVLFAGADVLEEGAVGLALGGVAVRTVVSQGCMPIGPEMVVTDAEGPAVHELAGVPAMTKLEEVVGELPEEERRLAAEGLMAGIVIDENRPEYERGDFLVRGIQGGDAESGALRLGERVRVGQTVRFQVRDADSADEDLREALRATRRGLGDLRPAGALVFTCNGRGLRMFGTPDHDAATVDEELGGIPAAGLFCNGEMGPVGGKNFLHGFTATMAVFTTGE